MSTSIDYDSKKEDPSAYYAQEGVVEPVILEDANPATPHYAVKRVMTTRQIQFYAIGGTIGTAVFVSVSIFGKSGCFRVWMRDETDLLISYHDNQ
jgi:amino acid permease